MSDANWGKTRAMLERKQDDDEIVWADGEPYHEDEHGKRRQIIGRDTEIDGGVYLGGGEREAIVVDSEYGAIPELYEEAKEEAERKAQGTSATTGDYARLATFETIREAFSPTERQLEHLINEYADRRDINNEAYRVESEEDLRRSSYLTRKISEEEGVWKDGKIALDFFIDKNMGVCRHQALAAGAIMEHFQDEGHLSGNISVDRNQTDRGGHAWARYESPEGEVTIIDPTQDVFAPLEQTADEFWDYERPGDNI